MHLFYLFILLALTGNCNLGALLSADQEDRVLTLEKVYPSLKGDVEVAQAKIDEILSLLRRLYPALFVSVVPGSLSSSSSSANGPGGTLGTGIASGSTNGALGSGSSNSGSSPASTIGLIGSNVSSSSTTASNLWQKILDDLRRLNVNHIADPQEYKSLFSLSTSEKQKAQNNYLAINTKINDLVDILKRNNQESALRALIAILKAMVDFGSETKLLGATIIGATQDFIANNEANALLQMRYNQICELFADINLGESDELYFSNSENQKSVKKSSQDSQMIYASLDGEALCLLKYIVDDEVDQSWPTQLSTTNSSASSSSSKNKKTSSKKTTSKSKKTTAKKPKTSTKITSPTKKSTISKGIKALLPF